MAKAFKVSRLDRAGWSVRDWCAATSISRSSLYGLPNRLQPLSVKFGRRRIVTEAPASWLQRVGRSAA